MKAIHQIFLSALLALMLPCFLAAQTPWILGGNNNTTPTSFLGPINAQPLRLGTQASQNVLFFSNNSERMRLSSNGLFGIGTTNPLYTLHVANSTNLRSGNFTNNFVSSSQTYGLSSETTNTGTGPEIAGFFRANGTSGANTGVDANARNGATNVGVRSTVIGSSLSTSTNYGLLSSMTPSSSGNNYGVFSTFTSNATASNNYSGYFQNGKVYVGYRLGIGLTAPLAELHVNGAENTGAASAVRITSGTGADAQNMSLDGNEIDALTTGLYLNNNTDQNVIIAQGGGRVGIGTSSPDSRLHIKGNLTLENSENSNTFSIRTATNGDIQFLSTLNMPQPVGPMAFTRMTIRDQDGNIGIGTSSPDSRLHVKGNLTLENSENSNTFSIRTQTNGDIQFYVTSNLPGFPNPLSFNRMTIRDQDGNVGIGTSSPDSKLHVKGNLTLENSENDNTFSIRTQTNGDIQFVGNYNGVNSTRMVIRDQDGRIGIGVSEPTSRLHVAGRVRADELELTGGSDVAENFDIATSETENEILPGMLVSINPDVPGQLQITNSAYDSKVAGIISGANGVNTGLFMGQKGSEADGKYPVALAGRVYVLADASHGPITPGNLLTSSPTPGYAMKAQDFNKAQGAVVGKAMTQLKEGKGYVLVLVNLQ